MPTLNDAARRANDPFRPFRPTRGRIVATSMAVVAVVLFGVLAIVMPTDGGLTTWGPGDRMLLFLIGVLIAALFQRYATIRAVPTRTGLRVRNLVRTHDLEWAQIVAVQFSGGDPWPTLDLDDTDQVAVMAIQRSDGARAGDEASRLAALVQALGERPEGDYR